MYKRLKVLPLKEKLAAELASKKIECGLTSLALGEMLTSTSFRNGLRTICAVVLGTERTSQARVQKYPSKNCDFVR